MAKSISVQFKEIADKLEKETRKSFEKRKKTTKREFAPRAKKVLKEEILGAINKGKSPVAGKGAYEKYSANYKKGRKRPINLKDSGDLHKSLKITPSVKFNSIKIEFTDKKFKYHNEGDGVPERAMLPKKRLKEKFNKTILSKLKRVLENIGNKTFNKD